MKIKVSFIIPVFNAENDLERCLQSIVKQKFSQDLYEILIIDGGSTDKTLSIVQNFSTLLPIRLLDNPDRDAESGKRIGITCAQSEYLVLLDADNEIVNTQWLTLAVHILDTHPNVWGVESTWFTNPKDTLLNQYFSLLKIADPVARLFSPTQKDFARKDYGVYSLTTINNKIVPIIGANGFFYRRKIVKKHIEKLGKFEEVNYVAYLIRLGYTTYATMESTGIFHYYCPQLRKYWKKRSKIAKKYLERKRIGQDTWVDTVGTHKFLYSVFYNASIILPLFEALTLSIKDRNKAWLYHPLISFITVSIYAYYYVRDFWLNILQKRFT